jgi:hypothetical protein
LEDYLYFLVIQILFVLREINLRIIFWAFPSSFWFSSTPFVQHLNVNLLNDFGSKSQRAKEGNDEYSLDPVLYPTKSVMTRNPISRKYKNYIPSLFKTK